MASGKTYVSRTLKAELEDAGVPAVVVNFDDLQRALYNEVSPGAAAVRKKLALIFGKDVLGEDGQDVRRCVLKEKIFAPSTTDDMRRMLHELVAPHIYRLYRETLRDKKGVIIVEWAQFAEDGLSHLVNNNVVVVEADEKSHAAFEKERKITEDDRTGVKKHQWSAAQKIAALAQKVSRAHHGQIFHYCNSVNSVVERNPSNISRLADEIRQLFGLAVKE
jgi:dephospho-CoA kinase